MFKKILITTTTVIGLIWACPTVHAQPVMNPGLRQPAMRGGAGFPSLRGPMGTWRSNAAPRPFAYRAPYLGPRVAPPAYWGPRRLPPGPTWGPRYWFWINWDPAPWPIYVYYPGPYYYYYYDYPYPYTYESNRYYSRSTSTYRYGNQYGNPGPEEEYQQPDNNQMKPSMDGEYKQQQSGENRQQGYEQQGTVDPKQYQKEYENWMVSELNLEAKEKKQFLTNLRKLQSMREKFMDKRGALTDELASLQQSKVSESELDSKMKEIDSLDKKFQKDEQSTLAKLMSNLTVEQRAKYYSLQSQRGQQEGQEQPQQP
jgi:hypothetical protein